QDLDGTVGGYLVRAHQPLDDVELRLPGGREADLDLLDADPDEPAVKPVLLHRADGDDDGLVAAAQVGGKPARGLVDRTVRPRPVGQVHRREGPVLAARIREHRHVSALTPGYRAAQTKCAGVAKRLFD